MSQSRTGQTSNYAVEVSGNNQGAIGRIPHTLIGVSWAWSSIHGRSALSWHLSPQYQLHLHDTGTDCKLTSCDSNCSSGLTFHARANDPAPPPQSGTPVTPQVMAHISQTTTSVDDLPVLYRPFPADSDLCCHTRARARAHTSFMGMHLFTLAELQMSILTPLP